MTGQIFPAVVISTERCGALSGDAGVYGAPSGLTTPGSSQWSGRSPRIVACRAWPAAAVAAIPGTREDASTDGLVTIGTGAQRGEGVVPTSLMMAEHLNDL